MKILKTNLFFIFVTLLSACDSYKEPDTIQEWKEFCEAPDSENRIKAIANQEKRQKASSICFNEPWKKKTQSQPRKW
ncbi:hypothetical protein GCM10027277_57520 [Pseudoduganella ginsengisoli]|uniref:Entry exclusion lipoprotein TrbK n=1 Tax=Pseudoduganella ginsengisoli TaxID=1462440 RepID=A0A6L6Q7R9_9BURK|nr:hypothetical protein [Pseudoduganella ginsengisoli]MTW05883.1 hypothetical protein [Pseudoduganella ginsengisoli]